MINELHRRQLSTPSSLQHTKKRSQSRKDTDDDPPNTTIAIAPTVLDTLFHNNNISMIADVNESLTLANRTSSDASLLWYDNDNDESKHHDVQVKDKQASEKETESIHSSDLGPNPGSSI
jgi:hypothetical protein